MSLKRILKIGTLGMLALALWVGQAKPAHALFGAGDTVIVIGDTSPTSIKRTVDSSMQQVKSYVLDGLAWSLAKIALQQITASTVNWINSGFEGNPSFLTDPGSFFADTVDQVTGEFIYKTGVLSQLCSPYSVDLRLHLALYVAGRRNPRIRYACTLSSVINNGSFNVSADASLNGNTFAGGGVSGNARGATVEGFLNGDFSQGGWPAYRAMIMEPQNNYLGALLIARDDLEQQIANKQNNIRADITIGGGFMSFKKCNDVNLGNGTNSIDAPTAAEYGDYANSNGNLSSAGINAPLGQVAGYEPFSGAESSFRSVRNSDGTVKYQKCTTETPGSVIGGTVNKALGIPQDTLNLADSINEIIGALMTQLVSQVLSGGLHSASSHGGNNTAGIATMLANEQQSQQVASSRVQLLSSVREYEVNAVQYRDSRQEALNLFTVAQSQYTQAEQCFQGKLDANSSYLTSEQIALAHSELNAIRSAEARFAPIFAKYQTRFDEATRRLNSISSIVGSVDTAQTTEQITTASNNFSVALRGGSADGTILAVVTEKDLKNANDDLKDAKDEVKKYSKEGESFIQACSLFLPGAPSHI